MESFLASTVAQMVAEAKASGAIPNTHLAPRGMVEFYSDPTSSYHRGVRPQPPHRPLLRFRWPVALTVVTLHQLGYTNVAHVDGGIKAWRAAGLPLTDEHGR